RREEALRRDVVHARGGEPVRDQLERDLRIHAQHQPGDLRLERLERARTEVDRLPLPAHADLAVAPRAAERDLPLALRRVPDLADEEERADERPGPQSNQQSLHLYPLNETIFLSMSDPMTIPPRLIMIRTCPDE